MPKTTTIISTVRRANERSIRRCGLFSRLAQWHRFALVLSAQVPGRLVTTEFVLLEAGDGLSHPDHRPHFARLLSLLKEQPDVEIITASPKLFESRCDLHSQQPDKSWSLTDCISFVVMRERGIADALTAGHHFQRAGFRLLMR